MRSRAWCLTALALVLLALSASPQGGCKGAAQPWRPRLTLLVSLDTCRADHLGCYGYPRSTSPNIDRLAREGVRFERAFSQANESLFSYGSLFTGRHPQRIGPLDYDRFRLTPDTVTLPSLLSSYGTRTAAYVAGGHLSRSFGFGTGFETYEDRWDFGSFWQTVPPAIEWLERFAAGRDRGFLFVQGYDAHSPYMTGAPFNEVFDPGYSGVADDIVRKPAAIDNICNGTWFPGLPSELWFYQTGNGRRVMAPRVFEHLANLARSPGKGRPLTRRDIDHLVAHYDGCIAYADAWVGLLMARLDALELTNETLVVLMGDHGEDLMEHGFFNHRDCVQDSTLHVPLIVWGPGGVPADVRVPDVVQLIDVFPTLLDYSGFSPLQGLDGRSLRPLVTPTVPARSDGATPSPAGSPAPSPKPGASMPLPPSTRTDRAYAQGILPMATVRSREGRLVHQGDTTGPSLPPLDRGTYRLFRIAPDGREIEAPIDTALARELWSDLQHWWEAVHHR